MPYEDAEWAALLELSRDGARHSSVPCSLLSHTSLPEPHNLTAGMFLEAVPPSKPFAIHACKVVETIDSRYIKVSLESNAEEFTWTTHISDPLLLPCGYCKEFNLSLEPPRDWQGEGSFEWSAYIGEAPTSLITTQDMFPKHDSAEDLGFCVGNRLEAVSLSDPGQICVATVKQTAGHLVAVQLDSEKDAALLIHAADSMDLFPTGWCQANNYPLQLPVDYNPRPVQFEPSQPEPSQGSEGGDSAAAAAAKSLWCPRLYINHWCYTGPYLSKSKVAKQSQSVGPGSVELVLREVLSMTISAAYIPTRVLRELERHGPDPSTVCPSWRFTPFKAKFKRYAYTANMPIATTASDVRDFLASICQTLQCCPNLWSTVPSGENCPLLCTFQMCIQGGQSSGFRGRGRILINRNMRGFPGATRIIHRRKRGGRKRLFVPVRANRLLPSKNLTPSSDEVLEEAEEEEEAEIEEVEDYEVGSGSDGDTSSRSSRPTSPLLEQGQAARRQRKVFPRVDMQAKGMRFPEYNTQMKARHKRKFEGQDGASGSLGCREEGTERREQMKRGRKTEFPDASSGLEPASVQSDPLEWTVHDVEQYVAGQPAICHHAVKLRQQEVDGRALLLLNLPTLVQHLGLPHSSAVALAQHICRVKLAHFLFYRPEP
ncbi:Scm-like with four MBT domains protein 2 [Chionoecetes opilio]|uniref:Scm-like with four MBT domains protein 2 n=1 Tax=Chionoecetes opilio TaxID=41210 RepID=A0A8J4YEW3_CHIOP|nr:Scm-like with four MBT domains protein 2 [Chionoecetes opilio]